MVIDCADGNTPLYFPILSLWIATQAEHAAWHGRDIRLYPKSEVPCKDLRGNPLKRNETRDYILYRNKALTLEPAEVTHIAEYIEHMGVKIGKNILARLVRVNPADIQKADLLHKIHLSLFKHMMQ